MLIEVVKRQPEQEFFSWLKVATTSQRSSSVLHFRFSTIGFRPSEEQILAAIVGVLSGYKSAVYMFKDGDIIIVWPGGRKALFDQVCAALCNHFSLVPSPELYHTYDLVAHGEQLRFLCFEKMEAGGIVIESDMPVKEPSAVVSGKSPSLECTADQLNEFQRALLLRPKRTRPCVLVVEDQTFSRKLLYAILEETYTVLMANDAQMGFEMHLAQAPDIVMLDIELPDFKGHDLAASLRRFDPNVFIIMVTANKNMDDFKRARENGAKAFIIKPYSKQKILDAVNSFVPKKTK